MARDGRALYFSRAPIPYFRQGAPAYRKHLGVYAYRADRHSAWVYQKGQGIVNKLSFIDPPRR